ncbi:MAG TPA: MFS transporter [Rhizomicrobium sp.]|nr:MFS transporter [Rhizomicrobium sp.]
MDGTWRELLKADRVARLALVCLGIWLNAADALVTATAMPSIVRDIGGYAFFAWPVATYLLGAIVGGASAGRLSERGGLRWALIVPAVIYLVGCAISAVAPSIGAFLAGRALQGAGAGLVVGACYVAMGVLFPNDLWRRVLGAISGVWGIATLLGPLLGGLFAEYGLWRLLFWLFAMQALVFALAAWKLVPAHAAETSNARIPIRTLVILGLAIVGFMIASVAESLAVSSLAVALGLVLFVTALRVDTHALAQLFPRHVANIAGSAGRGYVALFAFCASAVGFGVYGAAILQTLYGLSPLIAGYVVGADAMGWTVAALIVGEFPQSWDRACIRIGGTLIFLGVSSLAYTLNSGSIGLVLLSAIVLGAGFGACWAYVTRAILEHLPEKERAVGSSAIPAVQMIGNAVGSAASGMIANALGLADGITRADASELSFWLFVAVIPVGLFGWACAWGLSAPRALQTAPVNG